MPLKSQPVCSFYLTNSCKKGDFCTFSHGRPTSRVVCKHHISGSCRFGNLCRHIHSSPEARAALESPCVFWKRGSCSNGTTCQFTHEPFERPSDSTAYQLLHDLQVLEPSSESAKKGAILPRIVLGTNPGSKSSDITEREGQGEVMEVSNIDNPHLLAPVLQQQLVSQEDSNASCRVDDGHARISESSVQEGCFAVSVRTKQLSKEVSHSEPTVERSFLDGVRAFIGPGAVVQKVITAFDSCRVILANVPNEASHQDVVQLADTFGSLKSVVLNPPGIKQTAKLEYLDSESAKMAAEALDGMEWHTQCLAAQLFLPSGGRGGADLRSSTVKVSWFAPCRKVYAYYSSILEAGSKAIQLNGKFFSGRQVETVFPQPAPRQTIFAVIIKNLPLHVHAGDLKTFCQAESVRIAQASYHGKEGTTKVRALLENFGPLESFDCSQYSPNDTKTKALVRFFKPEHAAAAAKVLQGQSQSFLGGAKTWVTLLHSIKYTIPRTQYLVLETDLRRLRSADVHMAKVRVYDVDERGRPRNPVCIRIYGDDPKMLGRLKTQIEDLVLGDEVMHEGASLWDKYFLSKKGKGFVREVRSEAGAFVRVDPRRKHLRLSGPPPQKDRARALLLQKCMDLRARRHKLSLTLPQLQRLLHGEYARLQGFLGEDKLFFDIRKRVLTIHGDNENMEAARHFLEKLERTAVPTANQNVPAMLCPVCFCEVTTPVTLPCGHSYCFSCLRQYLSSAENFPVNCFAEDGRCNFPIPLPTISHMLPAGDEAKFLEDAFMAYIRQHPKEYQFCPSPDCQQIYRPAEPGSILRCPSCLSRICPSCHVEFHEGLTCTEHKDNESGGMLSYRKWKEENNVQSCPNCQVDIQKSTGCNHIRCIRCGSHICWVCLETWPDASMIYEHMSSEHGGYGL